MMFVCTANICRSPLAAELARSRIRAAARPVARCLTVSSAGVHGRAGAAMDPHAADVLRARGADPGAFAARILTESLVAGADLVLTAQRRHRAAAVSLYPPANGRVFTILEFERLARHIDADRLPPLGVAERAHALVRQAARLRGTLPPAPAGDDIDDPSGRSAADYAACAETIDGALDRPLRLVLG